MLATTPNKLVRLYSCDGKVFVVENEVLEMCATLRSIIRGKTAFKNGLGGLFSVDNGYPQHSFKFHFISRKVDPMFEWQALSYKSDFF